ncbi:MAG: hypothetical protein PHQ89_05185 [Bacilli bacterium]|nr:hypothetical protein [Bacilli bacterium]
MNRILKKTKNIHRILAGIATIILFCALLYIPNVTKAITSANSEVISQEINADIDATLLQPSPNPTTAKIGDEISVKYRLRTSLSDGISTGQSNITKVVDVNKIEEAVFVVDVSADMKNQARQTYVGNGLCNQILNDSTLKSNGIKLGIIGVGSNVINFRGDNNEQNYNNRNLLGLNNDSEKPIFENRIKKAYNITDSEAPNVMDGLVEADKILQQEGEKDAVKAIVLIVGGNFTYDETKIKDLKNRGYKIIVMDISYDKAQQKNLAEDNLKKVYDFFRGYDDGYYYGEHETEANGNERNYNFADSDCAKLALALQGGTYDKPYVLTNVKLNFDLGEGFAAETSDHVNKFIKNGIWKIIEQKNK